VQKSKLEGQTTALQCRLMELERKLVKSTPVEVLAAKRCYVINGWKVRSKCSTDSFPIAVFSNYAFHRERIQLSFEKSESLSFSFYH
jgi:hypothetical protein